MVVHVWKMKLSEATIAPASQGMKETTALQPDRPARQIPACASMVGSVSVGIPATLVYVLVSTQDTSARWSHKFLFSTKKHLLVLIITASMESALPRMFFFSSFFSETKNKHFNNKFKLHQLMC